MTQHCEGITLEDVVTKEEILLEYNPKMRPERVAEVKQLIEGTWESVAYPYDISSSMDHCGTFEQMKGAYLTYTFNEDGTFVRNIGSAMLNIEESGYWEISADGDFVVFHFMAENNPEMTYAVSCASLEQIDSGNLNLLQTIETIDFQTFFCTSLKEFKFQRSLR